MKRLMVSLLALTLAACGPGAIKVGEVIGKRYEPRRKWMLTLPQYRTQCTGTGSSTICVQVFSHFLYVPQVDEEDWYITIHGCDNDGCRDSEWTVTQEQYESVNVGDEWSAEPDRRTIA